MHSLAIPCLLLGLFTCALTEPVKYEDCGNPEIGVLKELYVTPCPKEPCILKKGQTYLVNVTFVSNTNSQSSIAEANGIPLNVLIPFYIPEPDGCKSGITCPIKKGHTYSYISELPVMRVYPSMWMDMEWKLLNDENQDLFCWIIPVRIKS
ncbi:NPC intracellular cholesterol transporter 2-like [Suncus etruscus]|uniref:NPC intracellular cholesterol transporter 2-like n=1 Tax=Suncus etruscus TaxID=109475 RepID=UPI0021104664|nr:NPC intracellular cholesterol transporter 2-like [Suncus etruscus]